MFVETIQTCLLLAYMQDCYNDASSLLQFLFGVYSLINKQTFEVCKLHFVRLFDKTVGFGQGYSYQQKNNTTQNIQYFIHFSQFKIHIQYIFWKYKCFHLVDKISIRPYSICPFHVMSSYSFTSLENTELMSCSCRYIHRCPFDFLSDQLKIIMALAHANENYSEIKICVNR